MANVRRFVGIDGRMLDDCLAAAVRPRRRRRGQPLAQERGALEEEVQVAIWRGGDALDAVERAEVAGNLVGNDPWRLAQPSCQLECHRRAEVTEVAVGRILDGQRRLRRRVQRIARRQHVSKVNAESVVNGQDRVANSID